MSYSCQTCYDSFFCTLCVCVCVPLITVWIFCLARCTINECGQSFLLPSQLRKHARKHKVYTCSHAGCGSIFSKWSELRKHSKMHSKEYKCPSCDRVFNSKGNLRQHQITHDSDRQTFCCSYEGCARVFSRVSMRSLRYLGNTLQ
jgi:uncharacterized Zn-finger protein